MDSKRESVALKGVFGSKTGVDLIGESVDSNWILADSGARNNHLIVGTSKYICNFKATLEENIKKYL